MSVIIEEGVVKVGPSEIDVADVLEYAEALILAHGWRQGQFEDHGANDLADVEKKGIGFTLHDSIGYACQVLSSEDPTSKAKRATGGKDSLTRPSGENLRRTANTAVAKHLPKGETDMTFNDKAADVEQVLAVLRAARQEVLSGS